MDKKILIIGSNSELAKNTILQLNDYEIYATTRTPGVMDKKVKEFFLDVVKEEDFYHLKERFKNIQFDVIINFTGIAVAGAVEELCELDIKKQLDVNFFGLFRIIKYFAPFLKKEGRLINVSSMASYGIFPFISPYCISKAACDILLNLYSIESDVKTVSIRPGASATKFWETSIEINKDKLENSNDEKFKHQKDFLIKNAHYNSLKSLHPKIAAKKIAKIIDLKNPKAVYNIGVDSKIAAFTRHLSQDLVNKIIRFILKQRIKRQK